MTDDKKQCWLMKGCPSRTGVCYSCVPDGDECPIWRWFKKQILLKEQETVAPVMVPHSRGIAYNCGSCGTEIAVIRDTVSAGWAKENVRYCRMCGRAVKW